MDICLTNSELCLGDYTVPELLKDIWFHMWDLLVSMPNGHARETEQEFLTRIGEQQALHAAMSAVERAERLVSQEPIEEEYIAEGPSDI